MQCEYKLCIYYSNNTCILNSIEIDSVGMCNSCIAIDISEEYLQKERDAALNKFKQIHKKWETENQQHLK